MKNSPPPSPFTRVGGIPPTHHMRRHPGLRWCRSHPNFKQITEKEFKQVNRNFSFNKQNVSHVPLKWKDAGLDWDSLLGHLGHKTSVLNLAWTFQTLRDCFQPGITAFLILKFEAKESKRKTFVLYPPTNFLICLKKLNFWVEYIIKNFHTMACNSLTEGEYFLFKISIDVVKHAFKSIVIISKPMAPKPGNKKETITDQKYEIFLNENLSQTYCLLYSLLVTYGDLFLDLLRYAKIKALNYKFYRSAQAITILQICTLRSSITNFTDLHRSKPSTTNFTDMHRSRPSITNVFTPYYDTIDCDFRLIC
ncbi:hypothetical protein KUTeg_001546 [Tegillarca granosa]|uniref:Uncharacterized protein n=1 Tax=Tegillarca granosa TaxID=220873 RepID=A0ABQ9FRR3_TEGGR|nr:hypothetical protein KUTeg_001546 [Tegillarca granosa]